MCGRVKLEGDFSQLKTTFHIPDDYPAPNYAPSWNVAPTDSLPIVRYNSKDGHRALDLMLKGIVGRRLTYRRTDNRPNQQAQA